MAEGISEVTAAITAPSSYIRLGSPNHKRWQGGREFVDLPVKHPLLETAGVTKLPHGHEKPKLGELTIWVRSTRDDR
eukprot:14264235-Heterocapsa_arctica.AAC.1